MLDLSWLQIDKQLESGEYFLNEKQRKLKKAMEKREEAAAEAAKTPDTRAAAFVPPEVPTFRRVHRRMSVGLLTRVRANARRVGAVRAGEERECTPRPWHPGTHQWRRRRRGAAGRVEGQVLQEASTERRQVTVERH